MTSRFLYTRGLVVFLVIMAGEAAVVIGSITSTISYLQSSETGLYLHYHGPVNRVDSRWPGVQRDDLVLAVNGQHVRYSHQAWPLLRAQPAGATVTVRFARDGREWEHSARTTPLARGDIVTHLLRLANGIALWVIGALAFFVRPGTKVTWLFFLFCAMAANNCLTTTWLDQDLVNQYKVLNLMIGLSSSLAIHLFSLFPQRLPLFDRHRWLEGAIYLPLLGIPVWVATFPDPTLLAFWRPAAIWLMAWNAAVAVLATFAFIQQRRLAKVSPDPRALASWRAISLGAIFGLAVPSLWNTIRMVFQVFQSTLHKNLTVAPYLLFAVLTAYSLVRHNSLAVDRFTAAVVGYGATLALLGLGFLAFLFGLPLVVGQTQLFSSPASWIALTAAAFVGFAPVYRRLKAGIDRWFFRDAQDPARTVELLRALAQTLQVADRDRSFDVALEMAMTQRVDRAELWTLTTKGDAFARIAARGLPVGPSQISRSGPLSSALTTSARSGGITDLAASPLPPDAQLELWANELALAVPVTTYGNVAGFLGVGRKLSGKALTRDDQAFYEAIAAQLTLVLERGHNEPTEFGSYRTERRIGVGGMAEVFLAWQLGPGGFQRKVALKRLLPHYAEDPEVVAMLLDEARIAAQFNHRHIARIYEVGKQGKLYFIAMEFVDGPSLRQLIRAVAARSEPVPLPLALGLMDAVLSALGYAHQAKDEQGKSLGVVHRDVTPSNIQLTLQGEVKLLDFGIARAAAQLHVTQTGEVKGTLPYMSPEQAMGEPVDARSDLYSAGAVLYELLAGVKPFPAGPLKRRLSPLDPLCEHIPRQLAQVVERALAYQPSARFASAAEMSQALRLSSAALPAEVEEIAAWVNELAQAKAAPAVSAVEIPPLVGTQLTADTRPTTAEGSKITAAAKPLSRKKR